MPYPRSDPAWGTAVIEAKLGAIPRRGCRIEAHESGGAHGRRERAGDAARAKMEDGHEFHGDGAARERSVVKKLNCQEVLDQLSDYLEADVAAELRTQIESHLNGCRHCHLEVDSLQTTIQLYRLDDPVGVPLELSERLRLALRSVYREGCCD